MKAIPAIDLREGACVQLVGGEFADERVRRTDVLAVVDEWQALGFSSLHVVDLDAACGRGSNARAAKQIIQRFSGDVQVGGGIRNEDTIERLFDQGASRVVLGTQAIVDRSFREHAIARWPDRITLAADVRQRTLVMRGWSAAAPQTFDVFVDELQGLRVAGILVTAVHVEGALQGPDFHLYADCLRRWPDLALTASGGIRSVADLEQLGALSVRSAVLGMALYTHSIDAKTLAQRFKS
jgi:phosphoribosylformimino-5-aminoimidazole carboxamide ribotide isomerase